MTDELYARARALLDKGQAAYGCDDAVIQRELTKASDPEWHAHLLPAVEAALQQPGYFATPRSIFEAGCGHGAFVTAALRRGHDASGIDNDDDRLALGFARIDAFGYDASWKTRLLKGDASATGLEPNRFDLVLGHQFIEHVPDPAGTLCELLRIVKPGGHVVLFAPDYRAPFEAHYEIPWPPFLSSKLCEAWLDGFGRPYGGLGTFFYVTAPQIVAILQSMNCRVVNAYNDRPLEERVWRHFDCSTPEATRETAKRMRLGFEAKTLPANFMSATSFGIVAQKL